jgi:hypothetical protein
MITLTFIGTKYQYLHDILIKAGYPPISVFVNGTTYTVNFENQAIADAAMVIADAQCIAMDKHARKTAVDDKYNDIYINLDRSFAAANRLGNPTTHLVEKSAELLVAHKAEKVAIDNE